MAPVVDQFWGTPTSTLDWCEANYEVSPFIAEFWNTVSNLAMIVPPMFGIYEVIHLGLEKKFILTHLFLIVVGLGSWAFHMTLLWPMQLADELPMVWGNSILIYQLWEIRKSSKRHVNWLIIVLCFTYCFFFTAIYLIFKIPWIHHGMYGLLVFVVVGLDLKLVKQNQCRTCTKLLSTGFFLYTLGFGLWNIDNQMCPQLTELRRMMPGPLRPFSQLHAVWHLLAASATYLHILFGIHARGHFFKPKIYVCGKYYGVGLTTMDPNYHAAEKLRCFALVVQNRRHVAVACLTFFAIVSLVSFPLCTCQIMTHDVIFEIIRSNFRNGLDVGARPFTQFHAYWHILAGFAAYDHILFLLHLRSHYHGGKVSLLPKWYGIGLGIEHVKSEDKMAKVKPSSTLNGVVEPSIANSHHEHLHNGKID